jgi:hypothetical protein
VVSMNDNSENSPKELALVIALYLLLTLLMTYPIAFDLDAHYSIHNDYLQGLWNFWWLKEAIFNLGVNPYFSDHVFYPTGVSLAFHTLSVTNGAMALPLQYIVDLVSAYNIVYLLTFVLSGLGSYLLVHDLTGNRYAAFLSGLILAYCPYHFVKSYQIWAASLEWMPLFAFAFLRFLRRGGLKYATFSALILFLASLSSWYLMVFIFLFIAFSLVYYLVVHRDRVLTIDFARDFAYLAGLFGILILPFAYPMIREILFGESHMYTSLYAQFLKGSHGIVGGRTGSTFQVGMTQLFGMRLANPLFWPGIVGYIPLILAICGVCGGGLKGKGLWVSSAVLYFLFLLGPYLTVFDQVYRNIPLPWVVLDKLPIFKAVRYPHRFMAPFMMCFSVLAGSGAVVLGRSLAGWGIIRMKRAMTTLIAIVSLLVLIEYFAAPIDQYRVKMSSFYTEMAGDTDGEYAVLEVPVMTPFTTQYMYFQTIHGKKIPGGQIVHPRDEVIGFLKKTPVIKVLANPVLLEERGEEIVLPGNTADLLDELGIRYILVHKDILSPFTGKSPVPKGKNRWGTGSLLPAFLNPQRDLLQETFYFAMRKRTAFDDARHLDVLLDQLEDRLGLPVFEDDDLTVYEVRSPDGDR